ncbi:hypothetical protein SEA_PARADIDDLES_26 [Streptomyces phage Paradiddles]|uniref:Uncharacterized protein n=2 Tax=Samistivirus TaxID=2560220 RepID=A0A222Z0L1_9CAUD|nr:hypothetical protein FDI36_gp026 [Streptomyces phage NootNoot]YP_009611023.1 hypothetical protein FDI37_gp026 [Streptomyces phage Paradiddles]ASR77296.1 hypothetical protein SEA_NOOTNOOT_26 [Streptomyces phage NootNoot]ASR77517.1 hypothetical protein SEA_PARADIDDLES_26 [Streptomyces phage Paradiddles]
MSDKVKIQQELRRLRTLYLELRTKNPKEAAKIAAKIHELNDELVK